VFTLTPDFSFDKSKARQALALGELERSVLDALWLHGEISGKEIFDLLGEKHKVQHNTLLTVLERLIKKGLVLKQKDGRSNTYAAKLTRDEFASMVSAPLIEELFDVSSQVAMSALVDSASADPEKLDELKKLIEEAEKKQKND